MNLMDTHTHTHVCIYIRAWQGSCHPVLVCLFLCAEVSVPRQPSSAPWRLLSSAHSGSAVISATLLQLIKFACNQSKFRYMTEQKPSVGEAGVGVVLSLFRCFLLKCFRKGGPGFICWYFTDFTHAAGNFVLELLHLCMYLYPKLFLVHSVSLLVCAIASAFKTLLDHY